MLTSIQGFVSKEPQCERLENNFARLFGRHLSLHAMRLAARWFNLSQQIPQPIASRVVTDACQTIWQNYFPDARIVVLSKQNLVCLLTWLTNCKPFPNSFAVLQFLRALPVSQRWHAASFHALRTTSSSSIPNSHATCNTLDKLSSLDLK